MDIVRIEILRFIDLKQKQGLEEKIKRRIARCSNEYWRQRKHLNIIK